MRVSVIIPTYNYGHFLPECVESVLGQTVLPDEIVIVDDGSTDNTPEVIRPYLSNPLIKYIRTENSGVSAARNTAITASTAEVIGLLDADDIWHRDKLELQLPLFSDPNVGVVYSGVESFGDGEIVQSRTVRRLRREEMLWSLMQRSQIVTSSALVRRACFERVGMFPVKFSQSEDYHLWLRIAATGFDFDCVEQPLLKYRTGHDSAVSTARIGERFLAKASVLEDVVGDPEFGAAFSPRMLRTALSANLAKRACLHYEKGNRRCALVDSIRSILHRPFGVLDGTAWRILVKSLLPKKVVGILKRRRTTAQRHPDAT